MQVKLVLNAKAKEIYDCLLYGIYQDAKNIIQNISIEDIKKDFCYSKKIKNAIGDEITNNVTIVEFIMDRKLVSCISNSESEFVVSYELIGNDDTTELIYIESAVFRSTSKRINYSFVNFISKRFLKKKVINNLKQIEKHITVNKEAQ